MSTAQQGNFDFSSFNAQTDRIPAGLQIFLAQQLLSNAAWQLARFDNPRSDDVMGILTDVKILRATMKADALARSSK